MLSAIGQASRSWKSAKLVALLATLALALGIGSTTAIYTVVRGVMLKPLPYQNGERFVILFSGSADTPARRGSSTFADMRKYQERTNSFDAYGWFAPDNFNLTAPGQPQHLQGLRVTTSLVNNLGIAPALGQWFSDDAGVMISDSLWRRLGADRGIVGQAISLNERRYTVTGVMPPGFRLPAPGPGLEGSRPDVWIALDPAGEEHDPRAGYYFAYARLKPGVTRVQAEADVRRVAAGIVAEEPASHPSYFPYLDDLQEAGFKEVRPTLLLLFGAAALLLLITCANVAALLLARSVARARETAIRLALGASRAQLALHYFLEGIIVALAGAALGVLLSLGLVRTFVAVATTYLPRADEIALDWTVLLFAFIAGFIASALFSSAPLWQASRILPAEVLSDGVRATAGARSRILSRALVVAEITLAFALLAVGAGLALHLRKLTRTPPGFDPENLVTFQITLAEEAASNTDQRVASQVRLSEAIEAVPGVIAVGLANQLPLGCCFTTAIYPEGRDPNLNDSLQVSYVAVTPGYFRAMKVPLRSGRFLEMNDASEELMHVMINEAAARYYWPNQNPLDAYGRLSTPDGSRFQIVGVVGDVRNEGLNDATAPEIYLMSFITPVNPMRFVVRSNLPLPTLVPEIRRAVSNVNAALPIHDVKPMNEVVTESVTLQRAGSLMTAFFALAALLMATLGVFGVVSYSVRQRTVEIGTRMALGADRRDVISLVVGGGLKMAALGIAFGIAVAVSAGLPLARSLDIRELSLLPLAYSTAVIAAVSMAASFFPAWRASLLSPMVAIRDDPRTMWQSAREGIQKAMEGLSQAVVGESDADALSEGALLREFTDAARRADTFREALRTVLGKLRDRIGADSVLLLEKVSQEYRPAAAVSVGSSGEGSSDAAGHSDEKLPEWAIPERGFLLNRLRFHSFALPLDRRDFDAWLRWAEENRPEHVAEIQALKETGARLAVPLRARREIIGVLLLGAAAERSEYSAAEKRVLRSCADQFALMIENARLTDRVVEQEKLRSDLELAAEVQRRLLPERAPDFAGFGLTGMSLPARSIGGDYYDFLELGGHRIGLALADVSGKGIAAALIMSVQASLRIIAAEEGGSLPLLAAKMNTYLHRATGSSKYATFFYAQVDGRSHRLRYVNAGHNPPYLIRALAAQASDQTPPTEAEIEQLSAGGTVLGLFPQASYEEAAVDLRPGDVLLVFTDGVTEAMNPRDEEFGEERLKQLLREVVHLRVEEISARISQELKNWIQHAPQYDDLTFLVLKVNETA